MANKLTLDNAGDEATFTVSSCKTINTKFGDRMVFSGTMDDGVEVETPLMPEATAQKQLSRLGLDAETCVGETLRFSRAANPSGKPYWNIDPAGPKAAPTKRLAPPTATTPSVPAQPVNPDVAARREAMLGQYALLWGAVAGHLAKTCKAHGIALDASAVQAATASVWIAWKDKGIQPDTPTTANATANATPSTPATKRIQPPTAAPSYDKFPPPSDADATDDLPF